MLEHRLRLDFELQRALVTPEAGYPLIQDDLLAGLNLCENQSHAAICLFVGDGPESGKVGASVDDSYADLGPHRPWFCGLNVTSEYANVAGSFHQLIP